jgi:hypothetical protein
MLASVTVNMNRKESDDPVPYDAFLPFPAAEQPLIEGMSPLALAITSRIVPSQNLAPILVPMKQQIVSTYYWTSGRWVYE